MLRLKVCAITAGFTNIFLTLILITILVFFLTGSMALVDIYNCFSRLPFRVPLPTSSTSLGLGYLHGGMTLSSSFIILTGLGCCNLPVPKNMATPREFWLYSTKHWWLLQSSGPAWVQLHVCCFHLMMDFCCEIQVYGLLGQMVPTSLWIDQVRWQLDDPMSSSFH